MTGRRTRSPALALVAGFVGGIALTVALALMLDAVGVGEAWLVAAGVTLVVVVGFLFVLGSRRRRTST